MRVFVTGATGFVGRALVPLLERKGHSIVAWVRSESRARNMLGAAIEIVPASAGLGTPKQKHYRPATTAVKPQRHTHQTALAG